MKLARLSPDGRYVFGVAGFDPSTQSAPLVVVPVAGGEPRELFRVVLSEGFMPGPFQWTPDSRAVLAIRNIGSRRELWQVPVAGGPHRKLDIDPDIWIAVSRAYDRYISGNATALNNEQRAGLTCTTAV